jgi:hypothetical protein
MASIRGVGTNQQYRNNAPSKVNLVLHHQCPGVELVSPVHGSAGATCYLISGQRVNAGYTAQASFNINSSWKESTGILMYELKNTRKVNENTISNRDEARCIQLVIIWKINDSKGFRVFSDMMEYGKRCVWDSNRLTRLVIWYPTFNIQHFTIERTYLVHDNVVLMTRMNVAYEGECYKLEMIISEGSINNVTWRPCYIDVDR